MEALPHVAEGKPRSCWTPPLNPLPRCGSPECDMALGYPEQLGQSIEGPTGAPGALELEGPKQKAKWQLLRSWTRGSNTHMGAPVLPLEVRTF